MHILKRTAELFNSTEVKMKGLYEIKKYKLADNSLVQHILPFENSITDYGLNKVGTASCFDDMFVGTGTNPASTTDTTMGSYLAHTYAGGGVFTSGSAPTWMVQQSTTARFGAGVATGNLTEVGIGLRNTAPVATNHRVWSRALIVDTMGNPITLTVLPDEYLDVTYILQFYPDLTDSSYNINVSGTSHAITSRIANVNGFTGAFGPALFDATLTAYNGPVVLGAVTGSLTNYTSYGGLSNWNNAPYSNGSLKQVSSSISGLGQGNLAGGITGLVTAGAGGSNLIRQSTQFTISPAIAKTSSKILTLNREVSWSRY